MSDPCPIPTEARAVTVANGEENIAILVDEGNHFTFREAKYRLVDATNPQKDRAGTKWHLRRMDILDVDGADVGGLARFDLDTDWLAAKGHAPGGIYGAPCEYVDAEAPDPVGAAVLLLCALEKQSDAADA